MTASRSGRHALVYRCDPDRCGLHIAHIADIEADLAQAYLRWLASRSRYTTPEQITPQLITEALARLDTAWVRAGHIEAANFGGR